jgi:phage-related protein
MLEVAEVFDTDTYRAVYTVKLKEAVYVLHGFQKKAKHAIATSQQDLDLIKARFKEAQEHYAENYEKKTKGR